MDIPPGYERDNRTETLRQRIQALEAENARLAAEAAGARSLLDMLPVGVSILDREMNIVYHNRALEKIIGLDNEQIRAGNYRSRKYLRPDGTPMPASELPSALSLSTGRQVDNAELGVVKEDGSAVWVSVNAMPVSDPGHAVLLTTTDITSRVNAERALKMSQARLARAERIAGIGNWDWDIARGTLAWSEEIYRIFGVDRSFRLSFDGIVERIHPDDRAANAEFVNRILGGENRVSIVFKVVRRDGGVRHVEQFAEVERGRDGKATRAFGTMQDVTDRVEAHQALRESVEKYRSIFESTREGILTSDGDGVILSANQAAADLLACGKPEDLQGRRTTEFYADPAEREALKALLSEKGMVENREVGMKRLDGRTIRVLSTTSANRGPDGSAVQVHRIFSDVTERRRLERDIIEVHDRLQTMTGRDLHDGVGQDLVGAAYVAQALALRLEDAGMGEARNARRIVEVINLAAAKIRAVAHGLNPVKLEEGGLTDALSGMCDQVRGTFGVDVVYETGGDLAHFREDAAMHVWFIAREAVTNALKHSGCRRIRLSLKRTVGRIRLRVSDDGKGIKNDAAFGGMGIRIMQYRASMLGGTLTAGRDSGGGTAVALDFPESEGIAPGG